MQSHSSRTPYLLIAPSLVFLLLLFVWPLAETALMAFRTPEGLWTSQYLSKMAGDLNFSVALKNTLILVAIIVPLQIGVALSMAMMLQKVEWGRMGFLYIWTVPLGVCDLGRRPGLACHLHRSGLFQFCPECSGPDRRPGRVAEL